MALSDLEDVKTGYVDIRGTPICIGDLLKIYHFTATRYRRKVYMYRLVMRLDNGFTLIDVAGVGWSGSIKSVHQNRLDGSSVCGAEVIDGPYYKNAKGNLLCFYERERWHYETTKTELQ